MMCVLFKLLGAGNQMTEEGGWTVVPPPLLRCGGVVVLKKVGLYRGMIAMDIGSLVLVLVTLHSTVVLRCGVVYLDRDER